MIFGYCRISTKSQFRDGTYHQQIDLLKNNGVTEENIFFDNESGKSTKDRIELKRLLEVVKNGDVVVVTKLDRLARNVEDALKIAEELRNKEVVLNILNFGVMDNTPSGRLMFTMFSAFAEFERDLIVERMQSARQYKRENDENYKEGRKKVLNTEQLKFLHLEFEQGTKTAKQLALIFNVSEKTIKNRKRDWREQKQLNS